MTVDSGVFCCCFVCVDEQLGLHFCKMESHEMYVHGHEERASDSLSLSL